MVSPTRWIGAAEARRAAGLLVVTLLGLAVPAARAFTCSADVNRSTVPQGELVVLTVRAEGDVAWSADFRLPDLPGVRVASGGTNQSVSMVNGRSETSVSRTFYLTVVGPDDFAIGPVRIVSDGTECKTEPIPITVTGPSAKVPPADSGNRTARQGSDQDPGRPAENGGDLAGTPGDDIFVTLETDRTEAYVGQQVILTFRYWRRVQPWNNPSYTPPRTEGFWREDLGTERNYRQAVGGRSYSVTQIRYALFPTRSGSLTIEPAELQFPEDVFDRFFNTRRQRQGPRQLRTDPVTIKVRDLPAPRPAGFSGLVASDLRLTAVADHDTVPRGEPVSLKVRLLSDGFLKGFSGLTVRAPAGARLHDAAENLQTSIEGPRLTGEYTVEKVIVPTAEETLAVPPVSLVWFDVGTGTYRTAEAHLAPITVLPGEAPAGVEESSGFLRSEISRLGEDLAFIHPVPRSVSRAAAPFTGGVLWWALVCAPPLLLLGWRFFLFRLAEQRRDPASRRRRLALQTARNQLRAAREAGDAAAANAALARAICGFVAAKTRLPSGAVDGLTVDRYAAELGCAQAGSTLHEILTGCDAARYGGQVSGQVLDRIPEIEALLTEMDAADRGPRAPAAPASRLASFGLFLALAAAVASAGSACAQPSSGPDPVRLLAEGNQAYTQGDLATARDRYESALRMDADDPVLHYNLGNTYARSGQLGLAVASYLRGLRLAPGDPDLKANLAWVRRHLRDLELTGGELPPVIAQIVGVVDALTLDQWGALLIIMVWLLAGFAGLTWFRGSLGGIHRRILLAGAAGLVIVGSAVAWRWHQDRVRDLGVVVAQVESVRSGPEESFPVLFEVHDGLTVDLQDRREGWVRISLGGEWTGWLPEGSVVAVRRTPDRPRDPDQGL